MNKQSNRLRLTRLMILVLCHSNDLSLDRVVILIVWSNTDLQMEHHRTIVVSLACITLLSSRSSGVREYEIHGNTRLIGLDSDING